jgi:hypothetical protein
MADIRRAEVPLRIGRDERLLRPRRSGAPERDPVVVMTIREHHERLLVTHEPRRLAVTQPLGRFGILEAQLAQAVERAGCHRASLHDYAR